MSEECQVCLECKEWCEVEELDDGDLVSNCCGAACTDF